MVALALCAAAAPAASADPPDPLASGPYGVNRAYYDAGVLQLTVPSSGTTSGSVSTCAPTDTSGGLLQYGQSSRCPGGTFPQPLEGTVTWPQGDPNPSKVMLFLHGRHNPCKNASGADGSGQVFGTGNCTNGFWPSWEGYDYISDLMASWGYTVISPSAGALVAYDGNSVLDAGGFARAQIIANTLDLLYGWNQGPGPGDVGGNLIGTLDFSTVGIMGHSRGGEGVTEFISYNRQRPEPGRRYNLRAVFALAPIDSNKQVPVGTNYATLLPACDGDVTTIAGANAFARSKYANPEDPFAKVQYYVEGANHNYYNTRWAASDRTGNDAACGSTPATRIRLSQGDQRRTGLATMPTFLRYFAGGEADLAPWITGEAGYPASACPIDATHVPHCEDLVKQTYIAPAEDRLDVIRPNSGIRPTTAAPQAPDEAGGQYQGTGFTRFDWCNPDPYPTSIANPPATQTTAPLVACTGPTRGTTSATSAIQTFGPQLTLAWSAPATLSAGLRGSARDVSDYKTLSLGAGVHSNDTTLNPQLNLTSFPAAAYTPRMTTVNFNIALVDRDGAEKSFKLTDFTRTPGGPVAYPGGLESALGTTPANTLHVVLNSFRLPLAAYAPYVDLSRLDRVELRFGNTGDVNATGAIQFGDLAFQKEPEQSTSFAAAVPLHQLASDPDLPAMDGVVTGAAAASGCADARKPKLALSRLTLTKKKVRIAGSARDVGCGKGKLDRIQVAVGSRKGENCRFLAGTGTLSDPTTCEVPLSLIAKGTKKWRLGGSIRLPKGRYAVQVKAIGATGKVSKPLTRWVKVR